MGTSIFKKTNPAIENIFCLAGTPEKVMCIPFDYAKSKHTALVCNGAGKALRGAFIVHNTPEGVQFVDETVQGLCRKHGILKEHVFFGGEDCSSIAYNFIHALLQKDYLGIGLHARDAALERENQIASTDKLDLLGIAALLIHKKWGRTLSPEYGQARQLRELTHHREALVKAQTASALRIHHLTNQLLPGFLDKEQSGLEPFSKPCLWLMSAQFSPRQILARKSKVLLRQLGRFHLKDPEEKVRQLKHLAAHVLPPPDSLCQALQIALEHEVSVYGHLADTIHHGHIQIARQLAGTPGAFLTSVPGMGITLAAKLHAETGDPARSSPLVSMSTYAGLSPRMKQTGGPDKQGQVLGRSRRASVYLKRTILAIALSVGERGDPELKNDYHRRIAAGQDARITFARRMLRICRHLVETPAFFLPPSLAHQGSFEMRKAFYQKNWKDMLIKWSNAGAIRQAFAPGAPLEEGRLMLNAIYQLDLPKTTPQRESNKPGQ
jgi:transposase